MAKNRKDLAESLLADESASWLTGFLADEDEFDRRTLWRLGSWGIGSVAAVIVAVLANQSGAALRHDQIVAVDLSKQSQRLQSVAKTNENETRRLASAVDTLNGDRDRLYARVTVLEQGLDSVTGSINRKNAALNGPEKAALSSPQAGAQPSPPSGKTLVSQASVAPRAVQERRLSSSATVATKANASSAIRPDATKNTESPESPEPPSPAVAPVASTVPATAVEATAAKSPVEPSSARTTSAKTSPVNFTPANYSSAESSPETPSPAAAPMPAKPLIASKPETTPPDPVSNLVEPNDVATSAHAKSETQKKAEAQLVIAATPEVADADPVASQLPVEDSPVAHTDFGVDLGSARSINGLRALWRGVLKSHAKEVASLRPIIVLKERTNGLGMQLRLVAGPLTDAAAAAKICAVLVENNRNCATSVFDGQRLAMKNDDKKSDRAATTKKPKRSFSSSRRRAPTTVQVEEPAPPPAPPKPSTISSFFSRGR